MDSWIRNQEEVFGRGLNLGQQREKERIIKLLEAHGQTTKSVAGFLGVCCCGQAIDDYQEHLIALIKGEN